MLSLLVATLSAPLKLQCNLRPVVPIFEVMPSRGVRALEGEDRGLSHLEVIARGGCGAS
jgi:hypothetical protein